MTGAAGGLGPTSLCCSVQAAYTALQIGPEQLLRTSDAKMLLAKLALASGHATSAPSQCWQAESFLPQKANMVHLAIPPERQLLQPFTQC